ncbi:hypothetical protein PROFUN_05597 [Planoprotostelium fungivorum]|uniref:Uncharacterized protein n=1 Tax=Planoprotostelium fungivorum TaxID=1890364 RepID=A0A2P6N072_9EUKA|nr:hypothetical protein PROFUN_05597 [Planoprotostelium fungivorum]
METPQEVISWLQQIVDSGQVWVSSEEREALHEAILECEPTPLQAVPCFQASRCAMSSLMQLCGYESANKNTSTKHEEYMEWLRKEGILVGFLTQAEKPVVAIEKAVLASNYTMVGVLLDRCQALVHRNKRWFFINYITAHEVQYEDVSTEDAIAFVYRRGNSSPALTTDKKIRQA